MNRFAAHQPAHPPAAAAAAGVAVAGTNQAELDSDNCTEAQLVDCVWNVLKTAGEVLTEQMITSDLYDSHNIDSSAVVRRLKFRDFAEFLRSPACTNHVQRLRDEKDGSILYLHKPQGSYTRANEGGQQARKMSITTRIDDAARGSSNRVNGTGGSGAANSRYGRYETDDEGKNEGHHADRQQQNSGTNGYLSDFNYRQLSAAPTLNFAPGSASSPTTTMTKQVEKRQELSTRYLQQQQQEEQSRSRRSNRIFSDEDEDEDTATDPNYDKGKEKEERRALGENFQVRSRHSPPPQSTMRQHVNPKPAAGVGTNRWEVEDVEEVEYQHALKQKSRGGGTEAYVEMKMERQRVEKPAEKPRDKGGYTSKPEVGTFTSSDSSEGEDEEDDEDNVQPLVIQDKDLLRLRLSSRRDSVNDPLQADGTTRKGMVGSGEEPCNGGIHRPAMLTNQGVFVPPRMQTAHAEKYWNRLQELKPQQGNATRAATEKTNSGGNFASSYRPMANREDRILQSPTTALNGYQMGRDQMLLLNKAGTSSQATKGVGPHRHADYEEGSIFNDCEDGFGKRGRMRTDSEQHSVVTESRIRPQVPLSSNETELKTFGELVTRNVAYYFPRYLLLDDLVQMMRVIEPRFCEVGHWLGGRRGASTDEDYAFFFARYAPDIELVTRSGYVNLVWKRNAGK